MRTSSPSNAFWTAASDFLQDPGIGLLQTPQCFMNADPVMRNLRMESVAAAG